MSIFLDKLWYGNHPLQWVLLPFSWVFQAISWVRRFFLQLFWQVNCPIPLIVVGNITVGGVGKTPLVIELAKRMQQKGLKVGIVSRGYGATIERFPYEVKVTDLAQTVGDEPLLLAQKTLCPVVIAPKRNQAVCYLLEHHQCQVIISDDGLQHYRMGRAIEIAVIDGTRGLGNGFCLPAGPLREPAARLKHVDFLVVNEGLYQDAYSLTLQPQNIKNLVNDNEVNLESCAKIWEAVAAIGNPQRFYSTLRQLGIEFNTHTYPDHYQFKPDDLNCFELPIIMTEKDAVKCRSFGSASMHYLPVIAVLDDAFWDALWSHQRLITSIKKLEVKEL